MHVDIEKLKQAGFTEKTYPEQAGVFWIKTLRAGDVPYVQRNLVGNLEIDDDDEVFVEVIPSGEVQMGIFAVDYYEDPVGPGTEDGRALLQDAGVALG